MSNNFVPCTRPAYVADIITNDLSGEDELILEPIVAWKMDDSRGAYSGHPITLDERHPAMYHVYFADTDEWFYGVHSGKGKESLLKYLIEN